LGKKKKRKKTSQVKPPPRKETSPRVKPAVPKKKKGQPVLKKRENPNWPLTALAVAGMVLSAYMVLTSWLGQAPLFCDEGSSCDIVQKSRWGTFLGLPTAFWGFLTYAILAYIGFRVRKPVLHWKSAWTVSLVGLGYSVYLNIISLFVIETICAYCLVSLSIMAVIFVVVMFQRPERLPHFKFSTWAGETIVIVMVIVGGMHLHYSGVFDPTAGPEDPYLRGLAEHLTQQKAVLYGAFW
jgi:uncharacterized membrane protein